MKRLVLYILVISVLYGCSTQKNTPLTRAYHNLTAHYNVYFNANQSFLEGKNIVKNNIKENYTGILPVFKYDYEQVPNAVSSQMNRVLEKAGKTILKHSITAKPKFKNKKNLTQKDLEFLKKSEYCKWIDDAYLLIGKANFYKHEYAKALISFRNILNKYKTENTRFEAQLWLAKTYLAQKKMHDALNTLSELEKDPRHPKKLNKEIYLTFADYYIKNQDYDKAVQYLLKALDFVKKKREKARIYFILAQLYQEKNDLPSADKYYKKVIKSNPPYDMAFSAKIARATAFSGNDFQKIEKQLRKLLKDEKNEEYQDKIYYALAILYLRQKDTTSAIKNLKFSVRKSVSDNSQKAISFLKLADIFFYQKKYLLAGKYYDSTMQYLDKNFPNYEQISQRAENTGLLVKYLGEVQLQDSLQRVAKMPENERNKLIAKLIEQAKEEQRRQQEQMNSDFNYDPLDYINPQNNPTSQGGRWYMYNPMLVSRGQNEFRKKWGNRKLEDNWRRKNKAEISDYNEEENKEQQQENKITDKTKPEYYLQNLPLNDSLMQISNQKIMEALFNAAMVYEERFNDYKKAIQLYEQQIKRFPKNKYELEEYYRLYKLYLLLGNQSKSDEYKRKIILEYPNSLYSKILLDPNYVKKLKQIIDKYEVLYDTVLKRFNRGNYDYVISVADTVLKKHPELSVAPYFLYLKAVSYGYKGMQDSMKNLLDLLVAKYKNAKIIALAKENLKVLESGKYDISVYSFKPQEKHAFITLVTKKTNITILKFQIYKMAQSFSDKVNYQVDTQEFGKEYMLIYVKWFDNLQQAKQFYQEIQNSNVFSLANSNEHIDLLISEKNFQTFLKEKNLEKYLIFYNRFYK